MPSMNAPTERDFEIAFSDLSFAQLRDKAPAMLDFLLGFQVVDVNEDQTHSVAVMGFRVGKQLMLVPSFFMNGEVKQNLIYLQSQDLFVPLQDNWITYLLSRKPFELGKPEPHTLGQLGAQSPDLSAFRNTISGPTSFNFHSRQASWMPWAKEATPAMLAKLAEYVHVAKTPEELFAKLYHDPRYEHLHDLPSFLSKTAQHGTALVLARSMRQNLKLANAALRFYKLSSLTPKPTSGGSATLGAVPGGLGRLGAVPGGSSLTSKVKMPKVRSPLLSMGKKAADRNAIRIHQGPRAAGYLGLTTAEREALFRGELVYKDAREAANVAYNLDEGLSLAAPSESGNHRVLLSSGEFRDVIIGMAVQPPREGGCRAALVIDKDSKRFVYQWPDELLVEPRTESREDWLKYVAGLSDVDSMEPNKTYVILTPRGEMSAAVRIERKSKTTSGMTEFVVSTAPIELGTKPSAGTALSARDLQMYGKGPSRPLEGRADNAQQFAEDVSNGLAGERHGYPGTYYKQSKIVVVDDGRDFRPIEDTLFVPKTAKMLLLKTNYDLSEPQPAKTIGDDDEPKNPLTKMDLASPSNLLELQISLKKSGQVESFKLRATATGEFYVDGRGPFKRFDTLQALAKDAGLRVPASLAILEKAADRKERTWLVKNAIGFAPPIPEPPMGVEPYSGIQEQYPQEEYLPIPTDYPPAPNYMDPMEQQNVMQAAQTGQKEVFDTSSIASLAKSTDSDDLIGQFLSDIVLGLDRECRLLFLYYWSYDKFRERYGSENLMELEDQLKDVAKATGDLVLFLKQRQVKGSPSFDELEIELGGAGSRD